MARARRRKSSRPSASSRRRGGSGLPRALLLGFVAAALAGLGWFFRADLRALLVPPSAASARAVTVKPLAPVKPEADKRSPSAAPVPVGASAEAPVKLPPANPAPSPVVKFTPPPPPPPPLLTAPDAAGYPRVVSNLLEAQIALARLHISSGAIDGVPGAQSAAALVAFQESRSLPATGQLDPATRARLTLDAPAFASHLLDASDFAGLLPVSTTWLGKSQQPALAHETLIERLAERTQAHPNLLRRLNPSVDWNALAPGDALLVPSVERPAPDEPVAHLHVRLAERILQARGAGGTLLAHFPVSIAKRVDKRPVGALSVTVVVPDPNYTFDPAVFPESAEARELGRKLILPPGPNNPVGVAWVGLDRSGYGIHGTPTPEQVGRTESHGCFRLANWDARALLAFARPGLPVYVEP